MGLKAYTRENGITLSGTVEAKEGFPAGFWVV